MPSKDQTIMENIYVAHILQEATVGNDILIGKPFFIKNVDWFMRVSNDRFLRIGSKQPIPRLDFFKKYSGKTITNHFMSKDNFERTKGERK